MRNALRNGLVILTLAAVATLGISCKKEPTEKGGDPYGLYDIISSKRIDHKGNIEKEFDMTGRSDKIGEYIEIQKEEYTYLSQDGRKDENGNYILWGEMKPVKSLQLGNKKEIGRGLRWAVFGDRSVEAIEMKKNSRGIYEISEVPKSYRNRRCVREVKKVD